MPGPRSLQAPHRPPEWGQVNAAMARTIPFPDEETPVAGGRLPEREGQRQHPRPRAGGKPSTGKARLLAPGSRPGWNVGGAGVSVLLSSACTWRPACPPRDANVRVHTMARALAVPGIPSPNLGPTHVSCNRLPGGGTRTWWVPAATRNVLGRQPRWGTATRPERSSLSTEVSEVQIGCSNRTQATGRLGMGDKHEPPGASGAAGHVHGHDATTVSQGSTDTGVTPPTPHLGPNG